MTLAPNRSTSDERTRVQLIYFNAGGGHRAAAQALEVVLARSYPHWDVQCVNLFDILDPRERFRHLSGIAPEDFYNKQLARGWTVGMHSQLRVFQAMLRVSHRLLVRRLRAHWERTRPSMVVSLIPNSNRALVDSLSRAPPQVPFVTVMTDLADYPPHFWIEPGTPQHLVCGSERGWSQAVAAGCSEDQLHRVSGMIVRPDFYEPVDFDRDSERRALGFAPRSPVGVVMFGGHGSVEMLSIARQLHDEPLILLCGDNQALADRLRQQASSAPHHVVGFTTDVRRYMYLGDYFIGKPGPGSLSEAVQQRLPVVTVRNRWTMPQERYNAEWVEEHRLGVVGRSTRRIRGAVTEVTARIEEFRANVALMENRAVFEVPDVLAEILAAAAAAPLSRPIGPVLVAAR